MSSVAPRKSAVKAPFSASGSFKVSSPTNRPAYLANRRAPRVENEDSLGANGIRPAERDVPRFADPTPFPVGSYSSPDTQSPVTAHEHHGFKIEPGRFHGSMEDPRAHVLPTAESERSGSPMKFTVVPCVAHPVYTAHTNCGCMRARSGSPRGGQSREAPRARSAHWDDALPLSLPPRPPTPPPPPAFETPQKLAAVTCQQLRHVAASGLLTVLSTESNGSSVLARNSITGAALPPVKEDGNPTAIKKPDVAITALANVDDGIWCGFLDGTVRIYDRETNELQFESAGVKHSGAVLCICGVASESAVFTGSVDWKIMRWSKIGHHQWRGTMYGGHTLGVRAMCEAATNRGTYLCSCGDDGDVRCWLLSASANGLFDADAASSGSPRLGAAVSLKKHADSVLSCIFAFGTLWTGGDDAAVRRWDIDQRTEVAELRGHTSGVLSMHRVGSSVWTLGKDGIGIMYDGDTSAALHTMSFVESAPKTAGLQRATAAQLFYVSPVHGHVLWVSDPAGKTNAWFAPTAAAAANMEDVGSPLITAHGGHKAAAAYEDSERFVELVMLAEETQRALVDEHATVLAAYAEQVGAAVEDGYDKAMRTVLGGLEGAEAAGRRIADLQAEMDALRLELDSRPTVEVEMPSLPSQRGVDEVVITNLKAELADARKLIDLLQRSQADTDNEQRLRQFAQQATEEASSLQRQLAASQQQLDELRAETEQLRRSLGGDRAALAAEVADLRAALDEKRLELDAKDVEVAALRAVKAEPATKNDPKLKARVVELEHQVEELEKQLREAAKQRKAAEDAAKKAATDAKRRDELLDKLLVEKDDAVAKLARFDVDGMRAMADVKADTKRFVRDLEAANAELTKVRKAEAEQRALAEQRHSDFIRLQSTSRDRDKAEAAVRQSYEDRIKELVDRMRHLERALDERGDLAADRDDLRKKLSDFSSPRYQELLSENTDLKRQLGEHKAHITRLLDNDQRMEARLRDLRERASRAPAANELPNSPRFARRSASPRDGQPPQDHNHHHHHDHTSAAHNRATCIWCTGAINVSMGSTLNVARPSYAHPHSPRSRSRSPSNGRSNSAQPPAAHSSTLLNAPPALPRSSSAPDECVTSPMAGSPRTVQRKKRVAQLEQAKDSTANDAVREALVSHIMQIHQQVIGGGQAAPAS
jgi:hypothetical protein